MPQVPQYQRQIAPQLTPTPYRNDHVNGDVFGVNVAQAQGNAGKALKDAADTVNGIMFNLKEHYDQAKKYEFVNAMNEYEQNDIRSKENGYLYKTGKDAMGKSQEVMKGYDDYAQELFEKYKFTPRHKREVEAWLSHRRMNVAGYVEKHDFDETNKWNDSVYDNGYSNIFKDAAFFRYDTKALQVQKANLFSLMEQDLRYQNADDEHKAIMKQALESKFHEGVLNAMLADNNLNAKDYYKQNKQFISGDKQASYISHIKNIDDKYTSRTLAENIISGTKDEEDALKKAAAIKDIDLSDNVSQRIRQHYSQQRRLKEQHQSNLMDIFYNNAMEKFKNGEQITSDDIPYGLDGRHYMQAKNSIDSLNRIGDIQSDDDTKTYLWYTAAYDAERFKSMNLSTYKLYLSKDDYANLTKRQQDIQKGDFYTIIKNTKDTNKYIAAVTGISNKEEILYNEYQGMVRALEDRYGRKATDIEKESILKYLGTNKDAYKLLERGVREQVGFYRNITNKISYYAARHDGEMPSEKEVYQWLKEDTMKYYDKKYSDMQSRVNNIVSKSGETKTLTYLADVTTPEIAKKLGINLSVTSRYRPNNKGYKSHHTEGIAMDVSMSEHPKNVRLSIVGEYLKDKSIKAIGTSDPDIINKYGKDKRIVDERNFDAQHGTNHVNHIHITTINDGTQKNRNDVITMKAQLKKAGYSDAQILAYLKSKGLQ